MYIGIGLEMEYLKWNNVFRLKYGHEKHDQHLESKTNATIEIFEHFSNKLLSPWKKNTIEMGAVS